MKTSVIKSKPGGTYVQSAESNERYGHCVMIMIFISINNACFVYYHCACACKSARAHEDVELNKVVNNK